MLAHWCFQIHNLLFEVHLQGSVWSTRDTRSVGVEVAVRSGVCKPGEGVGSYNNLLHFHGVPQLVSRDFGHGTESPCANLVEQRSSSKQSVAKLVDRHSTTLNCMSHCVGQQESIAPRPSPSQLRCGSEGVNALRNDRLGLHEPHEPHEPKLRSRRRQTEVENAHIIMKHLSAPCAGSATCEVT